MSSLTSYKSELVQSVDCELDMLKKGNIKCANQVLHARHQAQLRIFMLECLQNETPPRQDIINHLFESIKELTRYIIINKCIQSNC